MEGVDMDNCPKCNTHLCTMIDEAWLWPVKFCSNCDYESNPNKIIQK